MAYLLSAVMDKSLGTNFALVALFHTRQTNSQVRIQLHFPVLPTPPSMLETCVPAFPPEFKKCIGWGGGKQRVFKRVAVLF